MIRKPKKTTRSINARSGASEHVASGAGRAAAYTVNVDAAKGVAYVVPNDATKPVTVVRVGPAPIEAITYP